MNTEDIILRDLVFNKGFVSKEVLLDIDEEYSRSGHAYLDLFVAYSIANKEQLLQIIAEHLGAELIDLQNVEIDKKTIDLLDSMQSRAYGALPLSIEEDGTVRVALTNPLNYKVTEDLSFLLGKPLKIYISNPIQILNSIEKYYPTVSLNDLISDMEVNNIEDFLGDAPDDKNISDLANDTPIIKFVDVVLYQAVKDMASDIHFEPFESSFKIRYRIDGVLYEMMPPPKSLAMPVISRIKIMSGLNIAERRIPQDGRIQVKIAGKVIDLRVSTIPTQFGESVVLRVLDKSVVNLDLHSLGIDSDVLETVKKIINLPNGIFIVTGPTGSGKTTTLYSCLKEINKVTDKILTAEDPVEYDLDGIIQLPINHAIDMTFARALKAFLRQDPDIIMVGEIRDLETAQISIQAALTGHLVFTTLHTKEAVDALTRLLDMGVMPYLLSSSIVGVIGQRLVRKICLSCKTEYKPKTEDLELLGIDKEKINDKKFYYGKGCTYCNNTGYKGRKALVEILTMSPEICELVNNYSPTITIRKKAIQQGMVSLREDGIKAVLNGETTIEEVLKYT